MRKLLLLFSSLFLTILPSFAAPPQAITNLSALVSASATGAIDLTWTAPKDELNNAVNSYDLRVATAAFVEADWNASWIHQVLNEPPPLSPGSVQTLTVANLVPGTTYFFRIKSTDNAAAVSAISLDPIAWARVSTSTTRTYDLSSSTGITVWGYSSPAGDITTPVSGTPFSDSQYTNIATSDLLRADTIGTANNTVIAQRYLFKIYQSTASITRLTPSWTGWDEGPTGTGLAPSFYLWNYTSGAWTAIRTGAAQLTDQTFSTSSYTANLNYYISNSSCNLKIICPAAGGGKKSSIHSNYVSLTVNYSVSFDTTTPGAVTDLSAATGSSPSEIVLSWTAPGDDGAQGSHGPMSGYTVKYATYPAAADTAAWWNGGYGAINTYPQNWPVAPQGSTENKILAMPAGGQQYWIAMRTTDEAGRESGININGAGGSSTTVTGLSRPPLAPPNAPVNLAQYASAGWTTVPAGTWNSFRQIVATFTITDPFGPNTVQYNIQFSTYSDFSYNHLSATAPASATMSQGTTNYMTPPLPDGPWRWRVRGINSDGLMSAYSSMTAVNGMHFGVDASSPTVPPLLSPLTVDATSHLTVLFDWGPSADAFSGVAGYVLRVSTVPTFDAGITFSSSTSAQATSAEVALYNATWYWTVRSSDVAGNYTNWAGTRSITVHANAPYGPSVLSQLTGANDDIGLTWTAWSNDVSPRLKFTLGDPDGADPVKYNIQITTASADFNYLVVNATRPADGYLSQGTTWYDAVLPQEAMYWWRVKCIDDSHLESAYSSGTVTEGAMHFGIDVTSPTLPPILARPLNNAATSHLSVFFDWGTSVDTLSGIAGYHLRVSTVPDFLSGVTYSSSTAAEVTAAELKLNNATWYWTVRTGDAAGNYTNWAATRSVTINASPPNAPGSLTQMAGENNDLGLNWTSWTNDTSVRLKFSLSDPDTDNLLRYTIQITTINADFSCLLVNTTQPAAGYLSQGTTWYDTTLTQDTSYWWRVACIDDSDLSSVFSSGTIPAGQIHFGLDRSLPPAPALTAPADGSTTTITMAVFDWADSADPSGIAGYTLRVSSSNGFTGTIYSSFTAVSNAALQLYEGLWYWKVQTVDTAGNLSAAGSTWTVRIDTSGPSIPALAAPACGSASPATSAIFDWDDSVDACGISAYTVRASTTSDFTGMVYSSSTAASAATIDLFQGLWYWTARASDTVGNYSAWASTWVVRIDTTAPSVPALSAPAAGSTSTFASVAFDWDDAGDDGGISVYTVRASTAPDFSGAVYSSCTAVSNATVGLADGWWYWTVRSSDTAGNFSAWASTWSLRIDTSTTPSTPDPVSPENNYMSTMVNIPFDWTDSSDSHGISIYTVRVSTAPDFSGTVYSSETAVSQAAISLHEGVWYWAARSSNTIGYCSDWSDAWVVRIDTTAPAVAALSTPGNGSALREGSVLFDWGDAEDPNGIAIYTVRASTAPDFSGIVVSSYTAVSNATISLNEGLWYWTARSSDAAGNYSGWASTWTVRIDTTAPSIPVLAAPGGGSTSAVITIDFDWGDCADANGIHIYTLRVSTTPDFSGIVLSSYTAASHASLGLSEGLWYWTARSSDTVGNYSAWASTWTVRIDTTAPGVPVMASPASGSTFTVTSVDFDWGDSTDANGISLYTLRASTSPNFEGLVRSSYTAVSHATINISEGLWYWAARSSDTVGNFSAWSTTWTVRIDTTAPTVPILAAPTSGSTSTVASIAFDWGDSSDSNGIGLYALRASTAPDFSGIVLSSVTAGSQATISLSEGLWYWTARSSDTAGNFSAWASTWTIRIDTTAPTVPILAAPAGGSTSTVTAIAFDWGDSTDANGISVYTLRASTSPNFEGLVRSSYTALSQATLALSEGLWYWTARSSDSTGNYSDWASAWTIRVDTTAPTVPALLTPANGSTTTIMAITFDWSDAADVNGISLYTFRASTAANFTGTVLSSYTTLSNATITVTEGLWYWAARSSDTAGNFSAWAATWTVTAVKVPDAVTNLLAVTNPLTAGAIDLSWTAPRDHEGNAVSLYDIRLSTADFGDSDWNASWIFRAANEPAPAAPGSGQTMTIANLLPGATYYFRMRSTDSDGYESPISADPAAWACTRETTIETYDFSASTGITRWGYTSPGGDITTPVAGTLFNGSQYTNSASPDSLWADTIGTVNRTKVAQRYLFKIAHSTDSIKMLAPSWTGWVEAGVGTAQIPTFYIWNYNSGVWDVIASGSAQLADQTFSSVTFTSNMNYYVKNSSCNLKIDCPAASANTKSYIHTNYVSMGVAYTVSVDSIAPGAITDLSAAAGSNATEIDLGWTAPGNNGTSGNNGALSYYTVKYATYAVVSDTAVWWNGGYGAVNTYVQSWPVAPQGTPEAQVLRMPAAGQAYWIAIRTTDDAGNHSGINIRGVGGSSTTVTAVAREGMRIALNEINPANGDTADWVELYNYSAATYPLTGCTLVYNQGPLSDPGSEFVAWTAVEGSSLPAGGYLLIPSLTLDGAASHHVILKDAINNTVDAVQWPAGMPAGNSFSRIYDGENTCFEIDPTTTGGYANAVSTGIIRINEINCASAPQWIEFLNIGEELLAPAVLNVRNSEAVVFASTRTADPQGFCGIDASSMANDGKSWETCFGVSGFDASSDFAALENGSGQTVDRVTWGSVASTPYFDKQAQPLSYAPATAAADSAPHTLVRQPDGADSDNDAADVVLSTAPSLGMSNRYPALVSENTLAYPAGDAMALPNRYLLDMTIGASAAGGKTNTLWFVRTGGTDDPCSPHVFRLTDRGILLDSPLTRQTTVQNGTDVLDVDGNRLVNGAVYTILLNTDNGTLAAPQIRRNAITYDAAIHDAAVESILLPYANNNSKVGLFKLTVHNNSPATGATIELSTVSVRLTDGGGAPMATPGLQALFTDFYLFADNLSAGTIGAYQADIDTATAGHISGPGLSMIDGTLTIPVDDPEQGHCLIAPQGSAVFFIAARLTSGAGALNGFKAGFTPSSSTVWRDSLSSVEQPPSAAPGATVELITSSQTVITPVAPAAGTAFPAPVAPAGQNIVASTVNDAVSVAYCATSSGTLYAVDSAGNPKWEIPIGGSVTSLYDASYEEGYEVLYAASTNGTLRKIENQGDTYHEEWVRDLGAKISSDISAPGGNFLFAATTAGKLYKIYRDGIDVDAADWEQTPGVTGGLFGTPVIDDFSQGVNALWFTSSDGTFYRLNSGDGTLSVPVSISASGIETSPNLIAGFRTPGQNTHVIYFGDNDGYFRARSSSNLVDKPADWPAGDVYVSSPIRSSPYFDGNKYFYFGADNGKLYKVDADNGQIAWTFQTRGPIRCMPVVGDNNDVYVGSDDGCFYGLNTADGSLKENFPIVTGGEIRSLCWSSDSPPRIYFYSNDGKAYCIEVP